jgi:hypothetical protein
LDCGPRFNLYQNPSSKLYIIRIANLLEECKLFFGKSEQKRVEVLEEVCFKLINKVTFLERELNKITYAYLNHYYHHYHLRPDPVNDRKAIPYRPEISMEEEFTLESFGRMLGKNTSPAAPDPDSLSE